VRRSFSWFPPQYSLRPAVPLRTLLMQSRASAENNDLSREDRSGLRRYVSSHVCRVRMPWFVHGCDGLGLFRERVTYNLQPPPPWSIVPLIGSIWIAISIRQSWLMLRKYGRSVHKREGIHPLRQFAHMLWLAVRANQTPLYYYGYQRYRAGFTDLSGLFICSEELGLYYAQVYDRDTFDVLDHKGRFLEFCTSHQISTPAILHTLTGDPRDENPAIRLPRTDLFSKPINRFLGYGSLLWKYDPQLDNWWCSGEPVCEFCGKKQNCWACGGEALDEAAILQRLNETARLKSTDGTDRNTIIIQQRLCNHPAIEGLSLRSLNTARIITVAAANGEPRIEMAQLRMSTTDAIIDTAKSYLASIDIATGILGPGRSPDANIADSDNHPTTGQRIKGVAIPQWPIATEMVLRAHRLAPPIPIIGWDVAFTTEGPILLEANTCSQVGYSQLTEGRTLATRAVVEDLLSWLPNESTQATRSSLKGTNSDRDQHAVA